MKESDISDYMYNMPGWGGRGSQQGIKAHFTRQHRNATGSGASLASQASAMDEEANAASPASTTVSSITTDLSPEMENLHRLITASMENIIAPLKKTMDEVKIIVEDQGKRIDELEENTSQLAERVTALESVCEQLLAQNESLNERMEEPRGVATYV